MPTEPIGNCKVLTKLAGGIPTQHQFTIPLEFIETTPAHAPTSRRRKVTVLGCICGTERSRGV